MAATEGAAGTQRRRDPVIVLAAVAALVLLTGSFLALRTDPGRSDLVDEEILAGVVRRVVIDVDSGSVTVSGSVRSGATITRSIRRLVRDPETSAVIENGVLMIRSRCGKPTLGCSVRHDIEVPATASLDVTTDNGDVEIRNFASSGRISTSAGTVLVQRMAGESLEVHAIAGSIKTDALSIGSLVARSQAGSIDASFKAAPQTVDMATAAGAVDLAVPVAAYRLSLSSSAGKVTTTGIADDPGSLRSITAHSDAGNVRITGL